MYEGYTGDKEDKQAIFDFIVEKARKQNCQSLGLGGRCKYRGYDGRMCFVGFLIPDRLYYSGLDSPLAAFNHVLIVLKMQHQREFLANLQKIHDHVPPYKWEERFKYFAKCFNLIYTSPETSNV